MSQEQSEDVKSWSYYVWVVKNPSINNLTEGLNALGGDGWELATSLTTVKTWINLTGNDLVFVFKKEGGGQRPSVQAQTVILGADPSVAY